MSSRIYPSIRTLSRTYFDFTKPEEFQWSPVAIAGSLAKLCRFTGHITQFYSVAQHSVLVSHLVPKQYAMQGLLHDAAESVLGDVSSPLKQLLPEYKALEHRVEQAIFKFFDLPQVLDASVKHADLVMLATEKRDLMDKHYDESAAGSWGILQGINPSALPIVPWSWQDAEVAFILRYNAILEGRA